MPSRSEQAELQRDQQQQEEARVLQQHQQAVPVGVKALGVAGAEFHRRAAAGGIDLRRAAMVQLRRRHRHGPMAGNPDPPRQVELIREHEELGVEPAQLLEQLALDQVGAALRHQHLARLRRTTRACWPGQTGRSQTRPATGSCRPRSSESAAPRRPRRSAAPRPGAAPGNAAPARCRCSGRAGTGRARLRRRGCCLRSNPGSGRAGRRRRAASFRRCASPTAPSRRWRALSARMTSIWSKIVWARSESRQRSSHRAPL